MKRDGRELLAGVVDGRHQKNRCSLKHISVGRPMMNVLRWWLADGDVLWRARPKHGTGPCARFLWDDGYLWGIDVGPQDAERSLEADVHWDYQAQTLGGSAVRLLQQDEQTDLKATLVERGPRHRGRMSEVEVGILDDIAKVVPGTGRTTGRRIRQRYRDFGKDTVQAALHKLTPRFLSAHQGPMGDEYEATFLGFLESSLGELARRLVANTLETLSELYESSEGMLRELSWSSLVERHGWDPADHDFAAELYSAARLIGVSRYHDDDRRWELPEDVEDLAELKTFDEFIKYARGERRRRPWPTCPTILDGEQWLGDDTEVPTHRLGDNAPMSLNLPRGESIASPSAPRRTRSTEEPLRIFYSWQDGPDNKANRTLIHDALERAVKAVCREGIVEQRIVIDQDARGAAGAPDIRNEILRKIDRCDVFVGDVTIVGRLVGGDPTPNPNVMFELGYAWSRLDEHRVLLVFNEAFGEPKEVPFDLMRHVLQTYKYRTEDGAPGAQRDLLVGKLRSALALMFSGRNGGAGVPASPRADR